MMENYFFPVRKPPCDLRANEYNCKASFAALEEQKERKSIILESRGMM